MIRRVALLLILLWAAPAFSQEFGLSFSYFVPNNGEFSTPVSPFSLRGVGLDLNRNLSVQTGVSVYRMAGLNISGLPFTSSKSLAGPNLTLFVPGEVVFRLPGKRVEFDVKGGGFVYTGFFQKLNMGNFDEAVRLHRDWLLANGSLSARSRPGVGWMAGVQFSVDVTRQWGISFEVNYLAGSSPLPLTGVYRGVDSNLSLQQFDAAFPKAKLDLTGWEFSIGVHTVGRK